MSNPTVPATAEGLPELFSTAINPAALAGLSIQHLSHLHDACRTLMNVANAISCEPRFSIGNTCLFNAAGGPVGLFNELAARCLDAVANEAAARAPVGSGDATTRAWLLCRQGADLCDHFPNFATMVAGEASTIAAFENQEAGR